MSDSPQNMPLIKRRKLLATVGLGAAAGCGSPDSSTDTQQDTQTKTSDTDQNDCVPQSKYNKLKTDYEDLKGDYAELKNKTEDALRPPYTVSNRRNVRVTYETLDGYIDTQQWESEELGIQFTAGFIIREFSYEELEYLDWNVFGFEGKTKYRRLGDFGLYYQLNPFIMSRSFSTLAEGLHNRHQSDLKRIRAAWNFVTQSNDYVADIRETPRFPLETLLMGGGDCEDSAILLGSIIYDMPTNYNSKLWYIDADNPQNPESINHVLLGVEAENSNLIIETTSNEMLPFNSVNGFSVPIEPTGGV